jgi:CubicO group peptidase (beta-lactamase class C family)
MVAEGLSAMMVGHLEVPALDTTPGQPSTLSRHVVTDLLENELGFKGLVFTDALNMKGVANADKPGEIELRALLAGNDVLLFPQDPVKAIERIRLAVDSGLVPRELIDHKCLKVLRAKEWAGLKRVAPVSTKALADVLNTAEARLLRRDLYAGAITVLRNEGGLFPLQHLDSMRIASLVIGDTLHNSFQRYMQRYAVVDEFRIDKVARRDSVNVLMERLKGYDLTIVSVHSTTFKVEKEFGVPQVALDLVRRLVDQQPTALVLFANPYRLSTAYGADRLKGLVVAYEENEDTEDLAAQAIFGGIGANGRLPVSANGHFEAGMGLRTAAADRFGYTLPEATGVLTADLKGIDAIAREGITMKAYPGCQVLVAHKGQVIWNKAYGNPTYDAKRRVRTDDLYDLASISKVAGTTLALMKLVDLGLVDPDTTLGAYLPELRNSHPAHARLYLRDILTHQAGLKPYVPFYTRLMKDGAFKPGVASDTTDATHDLRVADGLYINAAYRDSLYQWVLDTPVGPPGNYVYSDMGMYLLMEVVERVSGMAQDRFLDRHYYRPLGLSTMGYRPWLRFPRERVMPTEDDKDFRGRQVWGDVHDPGAALYGGVAGHAGLFSDANDVAVLLQLLLDGGVHGGRRYLSAEVVKRFTQCRFCGPDGGGNRRGLGWDRPTPKGQQGPTCDCVSYSSFGHTGFTGTMAWADPEHDLIYVFLSNRVYPSAANKKLQDMNIRPRIQQVVHDAIDRGQASPMRAVSEQGRAVR